MFALPTACQTTESMDFSTVSSTVFVCPSGGTFQGAPWSMVVLQLLAEPLVSTDFEEWWIWWYGPTHSLRKKFSLQKVQAASWPFFPQISPTFICCMCWGSMTTRVIFKNTFNWLEWMPNKSEGAWAIILSHTFISSASVLHAWFLFKNRVLLQKYIILSDFLTYGQGLLGGILKVLRLCLLCCLKSLLF